MTSRRKGNVSGGRAALSPAVLWLGGALVILVAIRVALPFAAERVANLVMDGRYGFTGQVDGIDLFILRGAFQIDGLRLDARDEDATDPLLTIESLDIGFSWRSLTRQLLVLEIVAQRPKVNFVATEPDPGIRDIASLMDPFWIELFEELPSVQLESLDVRNGSLTYVNDYADPPVDLGLEHIEIKGRELWKKSDEQERRPARIDLSAHALGSEKIELEVRLAPLARTPDLALDFVAENLELRQLNPFSKSESEFDFSSGRLSVYSEANARDGSFDGYVKPLLSDVNIAGPEDEGDPLLVKAAEGLADAVVEVFENQPKDRVATKIPFKGEFDDPDIGVWSACLSVLQNAYIEALRPELESARAIAGK